MKTRHTLLYVDIYHVSDYLLNKYLFMILHVMVVFRTSAGEEITLFGNGRRKNAVLGSCKTDGFRIKYRYRLSVCGISRVAQHLTRPDRTCKRQTCKSGRFFVEGDRHLGTETEEIFSYIFVLHPIFFSRENRSPNLETAGKKPFLARGNQKDSRKNIPTVRFWSSYRFISKISKFPTVFEKIAEKLQKKKISYLC